MQFSNRIRGSLQPNDLSAQTERRRAEARPLLDLTVANPTLAGLIYPQEEIRAALADAASKPYEPDPRGLPAARHAIVAYYRDRGRDVPLERILLTSGTSEAYAFIFKLLCSSGESVLFPTPSYPLVEVIAGLEGVDARAYPLDKVSWRYDAAALERACSPGSRAVVAISPNNPTGTMFTAEELRIFSRFCAAHGLALIADEVFLDYPAPIREGSVVTSAGNRDALTFTLGGLSKACGLPQMKLAWIAVGGPEAEAREAALRLEFIADAFLSVGTPVQQAAPALLGIGGQVREQIRRRVNRNDARLRDFLDKLPGITLFPREGGWYVVIGLPSETDDEELVLRLLADCDVLVQPGYFYDFEDRPVLVLSLLTPEDIFQEGLHRIAGVLADIVRR